MLLKEAIIHFYCLFDESRFSDICTIMESKELNQLRKQIKYFRSSQPISMNFCTEFSKAQVIALSIVNTINTLLVISLFR